VHFGRVRPRLGEGQPVSGCCVEKERVCEWPNATEGVNSKGEEGHVPYLIVHLRGLAKMYELLCVVGPIFFSYSRNMQNILQ
jgi:hypothetical protein